MKMDVLYKGEAIGRITDMDDSGHYVEGSATVFVVPIDLNININLEANGSVEFDPNVNVDFLVEFKWMEDFYHYTLVSQALLAQTVRYAQWEQFYETCPMPEGVECRETE